MAEVTESKGKVANEDQVKFLISCIKHSASGRIQVDWNGVASECGIVSKAAAAKRFERLMKSFGLKVNGEPIDGIGSAFFPAKPAAKARSTTKKRKTTDAESDTSKKAKIKDEEEEDFFEF